MSTLRITAGTLRGRRVPVPPDNVRPTSERARQAFFNILGERVEGARFLDLFAGSGIFSFEAISRGAASAVAVDASGRHLSAIERLANDWQLPIRTIRAQVPGGLVRIWDSEFDLVYADPPYDYDSYDELLVAIDSQLKLSIDAIVAIEHRRRIEPFTSELRRLEFVRRAEYGEVWISMFEVGLQTAGRGPQKDESGNAPE